MGAYIAIPSFTRHRRVWYGTIAVLVTLLTAGFAAPREILWNALAATTTPSVIAPKVLTVTMFQTGDPLAGGSGEASVWVKQDHLDQVIPILGNYSPL